MPGFPVLLFLDVSGGELLLIMLVVFLVFGPEKMPEMARKAGRFMNQMKKASNDLTREFKKETSVLQNEIKTVQNDVNEQVSSISREINRTKAQVNDSMDLDNKNPNKSETTKTTIEGNQVKISTNISNNADDIASLTE